MTTRRPAAKEREYLPAVSVGRPLPKRANANAVKTLKKAVAVFGVKKSSILTSLDAGENDAAIQLFQKQAFSMIVSLISVAEKAYLKDQREHQAYVLNSLVSQGRELANDIKNTHTLDALAAKVISEALEPAFRMVLQVIVEQQLKNKAMLGDKLHPSMVASASRELDASLRELARALTQIHVEAKNRIHSFLLGE